MKLRFPPESSSRPARRGRFPGGVSSLELNRIMRSVIGVLLLAALSTTVMAGPRRPGKVQFSNGDTLEGQISMTPGEDFRLHIDGTQIRVLDFERLRELRISAAEEKMVQKWRFLEAGQTKKQVWGQPYLTRSLQGTAVLSDGEKITGHLYTTVLYLEPDEGKARKVIILAKQRGKEGEAADALAYPTLITFTDTAAKAEDTIRLRLTLPDVTEKTELAAVTWGALFTFEGKKAGAPGEFTLASPLGRDLIIGIKIGDSIVVGWPKDVDSKFRTIIETNIVNSEDFYDDRKLLGVYYDEPNTDIYSVFMLHRQGKTTMDGKKTQPWRLVIQRWKYDPETTRVLLSGRGYLFRGILEKGIAPPPVTLSDKLWKPKKQGDVWVMGY